MIYSFEIAIAANTAEAAAQETAIKLAPGKVTRVEVLFPGGCAGLVHARILRGAQQLWPSNPSSNFSGDGEVISIDEEYDMIESGYELTAKTWNDDDTFAHTIQIRLGVTRIETPVNPYALVNLPRQQIERLMNE